MSRTHTSLKGVSFIIADSNVYFSSLLFSMLKGFGADKIIQARDAQSATESLQTTKLDVMLCDFMPPSNGGMAFVRGVRLDANASYRKIPVLFMTSDTRISIIKAARDAGANMIITKPLSPKGLYDRLAWVAFDTRAFVEIQEPITGRIGASRSRAFRTARVAGRAICRSKSAPTVVRACRRTKSTPCSRTPAAPETVDNAMAWRPRCRR